MVKKFGKGGIIALSLHPLSRERARGKKVKSYGLKKKTIFLKKKSEKFCEFQKKPYLCTAFREMLLTKRNKRK